jgi:hypothetical protein
MVCPGQSVANPQRFPDRGGLGDGKREWQARQYGKGYWNLNFQKPVSHLPTKFNVVNDESQFGATWVRSKNCGMGWGQAMKS